jgi:hypothetical protein
MCRHPSIFACFLLACAENASEDESASSSESSGADPCALEAFCGGPQLCSDYASVVPSTCGNQEDVLTGPWMCVLGVLRDRQYSMVQLNYGCVEFPTVEVVQSLGDGTALLRRSETTGAVSPVRRVRIKPPEFFDPCLASEDPSVVKQCFDWAEPECIPVDEAEPPC